LAKQQIPDTEIFFGVINNPISNGVYRVKVVPDIHNYLNRKIGKFYNYVDRTRIVLSSITTNNIYELYERVGDVPEEYQNYN